MGWFFSQVICHWQRSVTQIDGKKERGCWVLCYQHLGLRRFDRRLKVCGLRGRVHSKTGQTITSQSECLEYLLGLDGNIEVQNDAGYWGIAVAAHHGPIWFGQTHQVWPNGHSAGNLREGYCLFFLGWLSFLEKKGSFCQVESGLLKRTLNFT